MNSRHLYLFVITFLLFLLVVAGGVSLKLWVKNRELANDDVPKTLIYQAGYDQDSFIDGDDNGGEYESFLDKKKELTENNADFVSVDLEEMEITLYEAGEIEKTYPVLSKGKEGSWWETPTGLYTALSKEVSHFSSIGNVWMPWSIQFYGNFFIHGWPYYPGGDPVAQSYSGGCIRLSDESAEKVFRFMEKGMPVLVYDTEEKPLLYPKILPEDSVIPPPEVSAEAAFIANLDTGEVILNKNADSVMPVASLAKLMTATVASELIYLERGVTITSEMMKDSVQSYPFEAGSHYRAFDLLYPLLTQSSNAAGRAIASIPNESYFIYQMNAKADSLAMDRTEFVDPSGVEGGNVSTLRDISKLSKYILEKRRFIYDISKGKDYSIFGSNVFSGIKSFNEFSDDPRLVGAKNGESSTAGQTYASVWNFNYEGGGRNLFIGILNSKDRLRDVENILNWLEDNFGLTG